MKEITRIHIAKVAYDIELDAKNDIEQYIKALERYANDPDILDDIEIRITELLSERGVAAGGVIAKDDVVSVRAQLGEPSDFAAEGAEEMIASESSGEESRRVYRDTENAIVGGVLSGLARFFNTDPLWVRLVFIVLLFASFGTALVVYLVLWLIVPPAETAAEKLRMSGQTVTLASIKELVSREEKRGESSRMLQRVLFGITGSFLVLMAIAGLLAIVAVVFGVQFGAEVFDFSPVAGGWIYDSGWFMAMMAFFIVSGLLFSALCFILASAVFRRQWTRRIGVAVVAIIAAGLVLFTTGVGTAMYGYAKEEARVFKMHQNTSGEVPTSFKDIKSFKFVDTGFEGPVPVQYIVSDNHRYELDAFPGVTPQFEVTDDGLSAKVKLINTGDNAWSPFGSMGYGMTILRVYGPELDSVEVMSPGSPASYHNDSEQSELKVVMRGGYDFSLGGVYDTVRVMGDTFASISLEEAVISELYVEGGGIVEAGVVRHLDVKQPDICTSRDAYNLDHRVKVQGVSGGAITYNGKERAAKSVLSDCGEVLIGDDGVELEHEEGRGI